MTRTLPLLAIGAVLALGACKGKNEDSAGGLDLDAISTSVSPSKRSEMRAVYHEGTNSILSFGGNDGPIVNQFPKAAYLGDTWIFEPGVGWTEVPGKGPSPRARYAIAVDEEGNRALLFGGRWRDPNSSGDYTLYADLWEFDFLTRKWTQLDDGSSAGAPSPRYYPQGAWDASSKTFTIWGGNLNSDPLAFIVTDEIHRWDGSGWTDLTSQQSGTAPSDRSFLGSTHDLGRNRLVVFGGQQGNLTSLAYNDTFALDLDTLTWSELNTGDGKAPSTRMHGPLVYDETGDRYILFGGHTDVGDMNDLWAFNPTTDKWSTLKIADEFTGNGLGCLGNDAEVPADYVTMDITAPERRHNHLYAIAHGNLWTFGGMHAECSDYLDDTWRFDLATLTWHELIEANSGEACLRRGDACECLCI